MGSRKAQVGPPYPRFADGAVSRIAPLPNGEKGSSCRRLTELDVGEGECPPSVIGTADRWADDH